MSSVRSLRDFIRASITPMVIGAAALAVPAVADEVFKPTSIVTGFGSQKIFSFDIGFVDGERPFYLLADRTNAAVDVVNTRTNKLLKQLTPGFAGFTGNNDTSGPNGVLIAEDNEMWVGDGGSKMWVLNGGGQVEKIINTGGVNRADELCFDPEDHIILMANDAESPFPFITFWDSRRSQDFKKLGKITFDGTQNAPKATNGIEQCQYDPRSHRFLVNVPEINGPGNDSVAGGVSVINPKDLTKVERTFVVDHNACAGPQGMAIGPEPQVLLGCNAASGNGNHSSVIIDDNADKILATINNESGADEVWFNPGDGHYFLARSSAFGPTQLLGVIDSKGCATQNTCEADESVFTANKAPVTTPPTTALANSHSVAADPVRNQVYVPIGGTNAAGVPASTVCGSLGGSNNLGCIAVYTAKSDADDQAKNDRGQDQNDQGQNDN